MNKELFKSENQISVGEGTKAIQEHTSNLEKIIPITEQSEPKEYFFDEYKINEDTRIIVEGEYNKEQTHFLYLVITEVIIPNCKDFNTIELLRDKYITNWNEIPQELQDYILSCNKYDIRLQEVLLYQGKQCIASMGITKWYSDIEVNSIGAGKLFQWNTSDGFTKNNLNNKELC